MSPRPGRAAALCAVAPALTLWACGGTLVQPIEVAALCPGEPVRAASSSEPRDRLIDDFENGDMTLAPLGGRDGSWVEGDDGTSPNKVVMENSSLCAMTGAHAGHFDGSGFSSWGANFTAVFKPAAGNRATAYDGRTYGGVSFWAAIGHGAGVTALDTPVGLTTIDTAWNGGVCSGSCMDYHQTTVSLTPDWRRFELRFSDLHQQGWGVPQVPLRSAQLVGFIVWPPAPFNIWIDDLNFEP